MYVEYKTYIYENLKHKNACYSLSIICYINKVFKQLAHACMLFTIEWGIFLHSLKDKIINEKVSSMKVIFNDRWDNQ
jgi:hypothetical protein